MAPPRRTLAAAALAASLSACGNSPAHPAPPPHLAGRYPAVTDGPVTPAGDRIALAYLKAHPAPRKAGMVAGIIVSNTTYGGDTWFAVSMAVLTARGHMVTVFCGDPRTERSCPLEKGQVDLASDAVTYNGQYVYVRADGDGNLPSSYRLIRASIGRLPQVCTPGYRASGVLPNHYEQCVVGQ